MTTHYSFGSAGTARNGYRDHATDTTHPQHHATHAATGAAPMTAMPLQPFTAAETAHLARIEAAEPVDAGQDARVEKVAEALWLADGADVRWVALAHDSYTRRYYRRLAVAALAAMHPADETLRVERCRACRDELSWGSPLPLADFIIWGKLTPPEHLGPRCTEHAEKALGWNFISQVDQWAVYDLRPLNRLRTVLGGEL